MKHYTKKDIQKSFAVILAAAIVSLMLVSCEAVYLLSRVSDNLVSLGSAVTTLIETSAVIAVFWWAVYLFISKHFTGIVEFYVSVLDAVPVPVAAADLKMNTVFINKAAEEICEASRGRFIGSHIDREWDKNVIKHGAKSLESSNPWTFCSYRDRNYQLELTYIHKDKYKEIGYVAVLRDLKQIETLFDAINLNILVTDMATDEVIVLSEAFRRTHGFTKGTYTGVQYEKTLYNPDTSICGYNKESLKEFPEIPIELELKDRHSNRFYKGLETVSKWKLGKTAYVQYLLDITDKKEGETLIKERLDQQELMTSISLAFLSTSNIQDSIQNSLALVGDFLNASHIVLSRCERENQILRQESEWRNKSYKIGEYLHILPFTPLDGLYIEFLHHGKKFTIGYHNIDADMYPEIFKTGIKTFIAIPIYVFEIFWGVVYVEYSGEHDWDRSDISLSLFLGNILSGVLRRQKTEADLMQMSSIANNSPQFISYNDLKGNYLFINSGASGATGYDYHEIQNGGLELLHGKEMARRIIDEYFPSIMEHGKIVFETSVYHKDGTVRMFSVSAFFIADLESGIGMIATDITEQRTLEQELLTTKLQAEQAYTAKNEFLYRVNHEMRTPMNSIVGMTDIAKTTENFTQISYCLEQVENASAYLLRVINDVLDMSKIEANSLELASDDVNLNTLIKQVTGMFGLLIDQSKLNLSVNIDADVPEIIISDSLRISQILTNLLSNAIRFTPENGDIALSAGLLSQDGDFCMIKILIADGSGVNYSDSVAQAFDTLGSDIRQKYAGSRIGFSIVKRIAGFMGGEISYESDAAVGSVVSFTLPAKIGALPKSAAPQESEREETAMDGRYMGKTALLVDDVDMNRDIFEALLHDTMLGVDCAVNGIEACMMYKDNPNRYDIIIMDIHMPEMNGYDAAQTIRAMNIPGASEIPIIAFSADVFEESIKKCFDVGMNGHIAKPVDFREIINNLDKYLITPQ